MSSSKLTCFANHTFTIQTIKMLIFWKLRALWAWCVCVCVKKIVTPFEYIKVYGAVVQNCERVDLQNWTIFERLHALENWFFFHMPSSLLLDEAFLIKYIKLCDASLFNLFIFIFDWFKGLIKWSEMKRRHKAIWNYRLWRIYSW